MRQDSGVDRREREPEAEAADHQGDVGRRVLEAVDAPAGHQEETGRRHRHAHGGHRACAAGAGEVAAHDRADGERDQEADQDQRRHELRGAVGRGAGEDGDVDQGRDQGRADEEADHDGAPRRHLAQRSARDQRCGSRGGGAATKATAPHAATRRYQRPRSEKTWIAGRRSRTRGSRRPERWRGSRAPLRSASRELRTQPARSTIGRLAVAERTRNSRNATMATAPTGVSQRRRPTNGRKNSPQVRSVTSSVGWMKTRPPKSRASASSRGLPQSEAAWRRFGAGRRVAVAAPARRMARAQRPGRRPG